MEIKKTNKQIILIFTLILTLSTSSLFAARPSTKGQDFPFYEVRTEKLEKNNQSALIQKLFFRQSDNQEKLKLKCSQEDLFKKAKGLVIIETPDFTSELSTSVFSAIHHRNYCDGDNLVVHLCNLLSVADALNKNNTTDIDSLLVTRKTIVSHDLCAL